MKTHEPTELIYLPKPSWTPAMVAVGLAALLVGLFTWFPYAIIGGAVALIASRRWIRTSIAAMARLPHSQRLSTAPIPLSGMAREKRRQAA
ncbi:MAG: hypothetical protein ABR536_01430 [Solirubrobacterales bacterium]